MWEKICFAFQQHHSHYAGYGLPQLYLSISLLLPKHSNHPHQMRNISCIFAQVSFSLSLLSSAGARAHKSLFLKSTFNPLKHTLIPTGFHTTTYVLTFAKHEVHSATILFVITDLQHHFRLFFLILILDWLEFILFNDHVPNAEFDNECTNVLWQLQSTRYYQTAHCTADNVTGLCHLLCSSHSDNNKYSTLWMIKWNW